MTAMAQQHRFWGSSISAGRVARAIVFCGVAAGALVVISLSSSWRVAILAGAVGGFAAASGIRFSKASAVTLLAIVAVMAAGGATAGVTHSHQVTRHAHQRHTRRTARHANKPSGARSGHGRARSRKARRRAASGAHSKRREARG